MPLTAITPDRGVVVADDMCESDRAENYFFCRRCGGEMRLVIPHIGHRIKFFRHLPGGSCAYIGESHQHLEAKMFFYNKYKNDPNYERVEVEGVLEFDDNDGNHIKRIGDVVLYPKDKSVNPTVIEVQSYNISIDEIIARFDDWNDVHDNRGSYKFYKGMRNGKKTILYDHIKDIYNVLWVYVITNDIKKIPKWTMPLRYIYDGRLYVFFDGVLYDMRFDRGFHGYSRSIKYSNMIEIRDFDIFQKDVNKNSYYTRNVKKHFYISYFNDYITGDHGKISIMYTHSNKLLSKRDKMLSLAYTKVLSLRNRGVDVESLVYNELLKDVNCDDLECKKDNVKYDRNVYDLFDNGDRYKMFKNPNLHRSDFNRDDEIDRLFEKIRQM